MTKIYSLFICCFLTTLSVHAQFEIGQRVLGGNLGLSIGKNGSPNYNSADYSNFSINASIGSFKKPNLLRGAGLLYNYSSQKNQNAVNDVRRIYTHSLGANIYSQRFFSLSQKLFFTLTTTAGINYSFGKEINTLNNIQTKSKIDGYGAGINLAPGLTYKVAPRWLFDAYLSNLVNISYSHSHSNGGLVQDNFNISSGLSNTSLGYVGLGFRWLMARK